MLLKRMIKRILKQIFCNHGDVRVVYTITQTGYSEKKLNSNKYKVRCERCGKIMTRKFKFKGGYLYPRPVDVYDYDKSSIYPDIIGEFEFPAK